MYYLVASAVKGKLKSMDKQIGVAALHALDVKVEQYLIKLGSQFNGHKARITPELVNMIKL